MSQKILWPSPEEMYVDTVATYIDVHGLLDCILALTTPSPEFGKPSNVLLSGHHGVGKSLLAANLTRLLESKIGARVPMITFDCSEDTFELMLTGSSRVVPGGETPFVPGPFPTAIQLANECGVSVFCAEEISALTPSAQKVFNRLTDWRNGIYVADVNQTFRLEEGNYVVVIGTMNPSGYGGVYELNDDLRSRFAEIRVPLPNTPQEREILKKVCPWAASTLVSKAIQIGQQSRTDATRYSLSTRDLVNFLTQHQRLKSAGLEPTFALQMLANKFEGTDHAVMVDRINGVFESNLSFVTHQT